MGFDANAKVEGIGPYNFAPFLDEQGEIPEPSPEQIGEYFRDLDALYRENTRGTQEFGERLQAATSMAQRREIDRNLMAWEEATGKATLTRRRELLSSVCSDSPSVAILEQLPGRVFDLFEQYIQEQLSPKASTNDTNG